MVVCFFGLKKAKLSERALELLALPDDGVPRLLLDIGILLLLLVLSELCLNLREKCCVRVFHVKGNVELIDIRRD